MTSEPRLSVPTLAYHPAERRYRFLLTDGRVVDVVAHRDDSDVRAWVIEQSRDRHTTKADAATIAGVADLGPNSVGSTGELP